MFSGDSTCVLEFVEDDISGFGKRAGGPRFVKYQRIDVLVEWREPCLFLWVEQYKESGISFFF